MKKPILLVKMDEGDFEWVDWSDILIEIFDC